VADSQRCVGVDWGTTHRRGHLVVDGTLHGEAADAQGALAARGRYPAALQEMIDTLGPTARGAPVVMSGMVGSAFGWREVPYLTTDVPITALHEHLCRLDETGPAGEPRYIVPGYADANGGHVDVMRGEEMQLLGAAALGRDDGWFVLPGTHSKWVRLREGRIERFWTFMTGELYAALLAGGTLASAAGSGADAWSPEAFDEGMDAAASNAVPHALFGARARVVTGRMPARQLPSYVSGVLVGAEWAQMRRTWGHAAPPQVMLIGTAELRMRHAHAAGRLGIEIAALEPRDVYVAALAHLQRGATEPRKAK
jgi:2-dehydro-3-deoxygalactonokinase